MADIESGTCNGIADLAGERAWYPNLDKLIEYCAHELRYVFPEAQTYQMVRDVFTGMVRADIAGLVSVGDEHEWAAIVVRANELAADAFRRVSNG